MSETLSTSGVSISHPIFNHAEVQGEVLEGLVVFIGKEKEIKREKRKEKREKRKEKREKRKEKREKRKEKREKRKGRGGGNEKKRREKKDGREGIGQKTGGSNFILSLSLSFFFFFFFFFFSFSFFAIVDIQQDLLNKLIEREEKFDGEKRQNLVTSLRRLGDNLRMEQAGEKKVEGEENMGVFLRYFFFFFPSSLSLFDFFNFLFFSFLFFSFLFFSFLFFYFILFYFILFYFILFYFILFFL